jgi:hypothetical protein
MSQVAEMANTHPVQSKAENKVLPPLSSLDPIVITGNSTEIYSFDGSFPRSANYRRFPFHCSHIIMVTMIMAHNHDISALLYPVIIDPTSYGVRISDYLQTYL